MIHANSTVTTNEATISSPRVLKTFDF